ncbi:MAG: GntR family transcriptional regulator [Planctomycetes bacterium]|nr:GntR family transcriptional regulator [Planctomycetota bacterium]
MLGLERSDPRPLYQQVKDRLRLEVTSGVFAPEAPIPDERTLAAQLGLSRMTVRRAMVELTREGLFKRIPGRGTFVRPQPARETPVSANRGTAIGVISPFDQAEVASAVFYQRILQGVQAAAGDDAPIMIRKAIPPYDAFVSVHAADPALSGLIVLGIVDPQLLNALRHVDVPTVLVDSDQPAERRFDQVTCDGVDASYDAVCALIALGHRDIAIMNFPRTSAAAARHAGYARALTEHGIPLRPELAHVVPSTSTAAYDRMREILKSETVPTAVFCTMDELAIGVASAVKDHGWRVPEQVSVVGFGDIGFFCAPALSTVRMPIEQMGTSAVTLLQQRQRNPRSAPCSIILRAEWLPRDSCARPRPMTL